MCAKAAIFFMTLCFDCIAFLSVGKVAAQDLDNSISGGMAVTAEDIPACAKPADDVSMITINISNDDIKGAKLRLQRDYVIFGGARDEQTHDDLLIAVDKDSFKPYYRRGNVRDPFYKKDKYEIHQDMIILITSLGNLNTVAGYQLAGPSYNRPFSDNFNLKEVNFTSVYDLQTPKERPIGSFKEAFIAEHEDKVTDVITCYQADDGPFPSCDHIFEVGAYDIKISYLRKELPKWQIYKQKIEKFMNCVTIEQPNQLGEQK